MRSVSLVSFSLACLTLTASHSLAVIVAYEGFDTDLTGSGVNYQVDTIMQGVDKARTGFAGAWFEKPPGLISASVNSRSTAGNLTYSGYLTGNEGMANAFRDASTAGPQKWLGRSTSLTNTGGTFDNGYYVSALVDFNDADGGGFGFSSTIRNNLLELNGDTLTFTSGGTSGETFSDTLDNLGISASGTNLFVIQYTTITDGPGGLNDNFYTQWNLWINPDISGGTLGAVTASGFGIGLLDNGVVTAPGEFILSSSNLTAGNSINVDEVYFTTDPTDFMIPEPSAAVLLVSSLAMLSARRRRRVA